MLAILKLGGSILCNKNIPFSVKTDNLQRFAVEIKKGIEYYKNKNEEFNLIIIHGGGSFGHPVAKKYIKIENNKKIFYNMNKGYWEIQKAMRQFNNIVIEELQKKDIPAVSIQPSSFISFDNNGNLNFDLTVINGMLKRNLIPIIHGDIVLYGNNNYKIFSGDHALPYLSKQLNPNLSLHASDVNGVYDNNKKTIHVINSNNINSVLKCLKPSDKQDITGGMYLKVMECYNLGIKTVIFNGNIENNIYKSLIGKVEGTKIN